MTTTLTAPSTTTASVSPASALAPTRTDPTALMGAIRREPMAGGTRMLFDPSVKPVTAPSSFGKGIPTDRQTVRREKLEKNLIDNAWLTGYDLALQGTEALHPKHRIDPKAQDEQTHQEVLAFADGQAKGWSARARATYAEMGRIAREGL